MRRCYTLFLVVFFGFVTHSTFSVTPPEIPDSPHALVYFPCHFEKWENTFTDFAIALWIILESHGCQVEELERTIDPEPGAPSGPKLENLLHYLNGGLYGYICILTHGSPGWIAVEFFASQEERDHRYDDLEGIYGENGLEKDKDPEGNWIICVSSQFLQNYVTTPLPHSLVFIDACESASGSPSMAQAFSSKGAHCSFGWTDSVMPIDAFLGPMNIFYRMGGANFPGIVEQDTDDLRNKSAQVAKDEYNNPNLDLIIENGDMRMYNSPRIVGVLVTQLEDEMDKVIYRYGFSETNEPPAYPYEVPDYPGDLTNCPIDPARAKRPILIKILFSAPMDPANITVNITPEDESSPIEVPGSWRKEVFDYDTWIGEVTISEWEDPCGVVVIQVDAQDAYVDDLNARPHILPSCFRIVKSFRQQFPPSFLVRRGPIRRNRQECAKRI